MSRNDPIGVARAVALYWNLVPQDARHDLLIHCLSHTTTAGCIDALVAAYDEREIGEIVAKLTALHSYLKEEQGESNMHKLGESEQLSFEIPKKDPEYRGHIIYVCRDSNNWDHWIAHYGTPDESTPEYRWPDPYPRTRAGGGCLHGPFKSRAEAEEAARAAIDENIIE